MTDTQARADNLQVYVSEADALRAHIVELRAENERLEGLIVSLTDNGPEYRGPAWNRAVTTLEVEAARIFYVRQRGHKALKEPDDDSLARSASAAKRHVESWPKWKQEAMRREVGIKEPDNRMEHPRQPGRGPR